MREGRIGAQSTEPTPRTLPGPSQRRPPTILSLALSLSRWLSRALSVSLARSRSLSLSLSLSASLSLAHTHSRVRAVCLHSGLQQR